MTKADIFVLEFMDDVGVWVNPATLAFNLDYANSYMSERCNQLEERDLVERSDKKAFYRITDRGRQYLKGEIGPDELDDE